MSRLTEQILDEFKDINYAYNDSSKFDTLKRMLNDAVEVVHGEWIPFQRPNGGYYTGCSICSFPMPTDSMCDFMDETDNRFCYNCGAKMDGEGKKDD